MSVALNTSSCNNPGFTLPPWVLQDVFVTLYGTSSTGMDKMQVEMVTTLLSTIFLGMYTLCVAYVARILICRGLTGTRRWLLYVTLAMYLATFASWVALVINQFQTLHILKRNLSQTYSLFPPLSCFTDTVDLPEYCTIVPVTGPQYVLEWPTTFECVETSALTFNVVLGDAIVWWRVWVLWNKSRRLLVLCCLVLFATLGFGALDSTLSCNEPSGFNNFINQYGFTQEAPNEGSFFQFTLPGVIVICLSLFSNTVATLLVGYRALKHRWNTKAHFAGVPSVVRVQRALMLLFESGIAYSVIWAVFLSSQTSIFDYKIVSGAPTFILNMQYFTQGCLLALVGIYPTLIIILVALDKSEIEKQSNAWSLPVVHAGHHPRPRREADTDLSQSEDVGLGGGLCTESVILVGMSSSAQSSDATSEDETSSLKAEASRVDLAVVDASVRD